MGLKDYYQILGLAPSATLAEIKKAYRRLAQQYHPDKIAHDAAGHLQFAEIKEAYEVLSNPTKKNITCNSVGTSNQPAEKNFSGHLPPFRYYNRCSNLKDRFPGWIPTAWIKKGYSIMH